MGYYEYLQALDLSTPASELRQADLYAALGETARAQRQLNALLDQDIGSAVQRGDQSSIEPSDNQSVAFDADVSERRRCGQGELVCDRTRTNRVSNTFGDRRGGPTSDEPNWSHPVP